MDANVAAGSAIVPYAVAVIEMPVARVGFEDSDAGLDPCLPSRRRRVASRYCRSWLHRYRRCIQSNNPVAIEVEKPLACTGTEYADLGSQRILAIKRRGTACARAHAYIDCCGAGAAAGAGPTDKRGVCRWGCGERYGRAAGVRTRASRAAVYARGTTSYSTTAGASIGDTKSESRGRL